MELNALMQVLETLAPHALAEEWDNCGLIIEPEQSDITRVLIALDCTPAVAREAKEKNVQLVITHHPLFMKPVRSLYHSKPETAAAYLLARHGIGLFTAHTNLDSAMGGVNDVLCETLGLTGVCSLTAPEAALTTENAGLGRVGNLKAPMTLRTFAAFSRDALGTTVRYGGGADRLVSRVAVVGGSGGDLLTQACAAGADVLLTGEIRHAQALAADVLGLCVVEAGHHETECVVLPSFIRSLQQALGAIQCKMDFILADESSSPLVAP